MLYLVFDTYESAYVANAVISLNMRLKGDVTDAWSTVRQRLDGKYILPVPQEGDMQYVSGYTDMQEYSTEWFPPDTVVMGE